MQLHIYYFKNKNEEKCFGKTLFIKYTYTKPAFFSSPKQILKRKKYSQLSSMQFGYLKYDYKSIPLQGKKCSIVIINEVYV